MLGLELLHVALGDTAEVAGHDRFFVNGIVVGKEYLEFGNGPVRRAVAGTALEVRRDLGTGLFVLGASAFFFLGHRYVGRRCHALPERRDAGERFRKLGGKIAEGEGACLKGRGEEKQCRDSSADFVPVHSERD